MQSGDKNPVNVYLLFPWRDGGLFSARWPLLAPNVSPPLQLQDGNMKTDAEAPLPPGREAFAIRCRDVCRSYGKLKVLSNLNLSVPQGQM